VLFPRAREADHALAQRWAADGLDIHDCLAVVAHLVARQLARGEPMESLAYADRRIRGEGLPRFPPEVDLAGYGRLRYQVGFPGPVDPEAERYARRVYEFDPHLGGWAFDGLGRGSNQVLNWGDSPPVQLVPPKEASS
jgi:hypothetical protein